MNIKSTSVVSNHMRYHLDNSILISENIFRYGSKAWSELICEARELYQNGEVIELDEDEYYMIESDVGIVVMSDDREVMLDTPEPVWGTNMCEVFTRRGDEIIRIEFENKLQEI